MSTRGGQDRHVVDEHHDHVVGFYEDDAFLVDSVVGFLAPALRAGHAGLVIGAPDHRERIEGALRAEGIPVAAARAEGRLVQLDAAETLAELTVAGTPDPAAFRRVIVPWLDRAAAGGREVHVHGEMVALLWERGEVPAAIALEDLWNDLLAEVPFRLLCTYPLHTFGARGSAEQFDAMCRRHSAVIPSESYSGLDDAEARRRRVVAMQQEAVTSAVEREALTVRQRELGEALDELRELDRLRREFVAMVVHDIQGPASTVAAFLDLLRDEWDELTTEQVTDILARAGRGTQRIKRLAADVANMARIEAGEITYDVRPTDLGDLVERIADETRLSAGRPVEVEVAAGLPPALADEQRQAQILTNLLGNAVKYSPESSVVTVTVGVEDDQLVVAVRDAGAGIPADQQHLLFRPFSRLRTDTGEQQGTGLGLCAAKGLVEGQGGRIWVDSEVGRGSTFAYTVPTASRGPSPEHQAGP